MVLPASLPFILAGLRIAAGRGLTAVVAGELFGARHGLGLQILEGATTFDTASVYVALLLFAFGGVAVTRVIGVIETRFVWWANAA